MFLALITTLYAAPPNPSAPPIINGETATSDDFPMAGAQLMTGEVDFFGSTTELRTFVCSSTLIAPDTVLLAAHCLDDFAFTFGLAEIEDKQLYWTRTADLTSWSNPEHSNPLPEDAVAVIDYAIHGGFDMMSMDIGLSENDDIALMFLETPVTDIDHAFLPSIDEAAQIATGEDVMVVGWGQQVATSQMESPPPGTYAIKQQGTSQIVEVSAFEFKVGELESDVRKCHGDSGGPSFWDGGDGYRLIGVTSHAYDESDCFETGGVDTRVDYYLDWIEAQMSERCLDGTRSWCEVEGIVTPEYYESLEDSNKLACSNAGLKDLSYWLVGLLFLYRRKK